MTFSNHTFVIDNKHWFIIKGFLGTWGATRICFRILTIYHLYEWYIPSYKSRKIHMLCERYIIFVEHNLRVLNEIFIRIQEKIEKWFWYNFSKPDSLKTPCIICSTTNDSFEHKIQLLGIILDMELK